MPTRQAKGRDAVYPGPTADIGIAMGRGGTDVAREAVERVICDGNIRKVIYPLPSTGAAEWDAAGRLLQAGDPKSHRAGLAGRQTQIIVWHARNNRISRSQVHARF